MKVEVNFANGYGASWVMLLSCCYFIRFARQIDSIACTSAKAFVLPHASCLQDRNVSSSNAKFTFAHILGSDFFEIFGRFDVFIYFCVFSDVFERFGSFSDVPDLKTVPERI